jgi:hypothetical protein
MSELIPKIQLTLGDKVLETTRRMVTALSKFDAVGSIKHNGNCNEVYDAINEEIADFQNYLGATDGDDATHFFGHEEALTIANVSALDDAYEQIAQARWLLGSDANKVQISDCLQAWIDHLYKYANACDKHTFRFFDGHSTFELEDGKHPFPNMQLLLEERLGLRLCIDDGRYYYMAYDGRGAEYGDWQFCPKVEERVCYSQGKPIKLEDGSYKKDEYGKIVYSEFTQYVDREYIIEVTKHSTDPDQVHTIDVPFGKFYGFYTQIINQ